MSKTKYNRQKNSVEILNEMGISRRYRPEPTIKTHKSKFQKIVSIVTALLLLSGTIIPIILSILSMRNF